jgi:6-pyruvoyltetrahydropterin/6-carboxytetrahydropterin synthase
MSTTGAARVTIRLAKENMKFSAGHFTIFGPGSRERLHGHNFRVAATIEAEVLANGLCFDYGIYKDRIVALCRELNEWFILPTRSDLLRIEQTDTHVIAHFGEERIPFLRGDVLLLPIENATLEEFSRYLLERLAADRAELDRFGIRAIELEVFSGPGQSAAVRHDFQGGAAAAPRAKASLPPLAGEAAEG